MRSNYNRKLSLIFWYWFYHFKKEVLFFNITTTRNIIKKISLLTIIDSRISFSYQVSLIIIIHNILKLISNFEQKSLTVWSTQSLMKWFETMRFNILILVS